MDLGKVLSAALLSLAVAAFSVSTYSAHLVFLGIESLNYWWSWSEGYGAPISALYITQYYIVIRTLVFLVSIGLGVLTILLYQRSR